MTAKAPGAIPRIDWEQVREKLRASERALSEALTENSDRAAIAYRKRAAQLAQRQAPDRLRAAGVPVLVFNLQQERYAIPLDRLAGVRPFTSCTAVPGTPPELLGVINVRGELRPVIDLSLMILRVGTPALPPGFLLMLRHHAEEVGLKIERIDGLHNIKPESLSASPHEKYASQLVGETFSLLNVEKLLADISAKQESSIG